MRYIVKNIDINRNGTLHKENSVIELDVEAAEELKQYLEPVTEDAPIETSDGAKINSSLDEMQSIKEAEDLDKLKEKATGLGVSFAPSIGFKTLFDRVEEHLKTSEGNK